MKKGILAAFLILMIAGMCNRPVAAVAGQKDEIDVKRILELIEEPEPIEQILNGNGSLCFSYDENKRRTKKLLLERIVEYFYEDDVLINETGEHNIQYFYSDIDGNFLCTEIIADDERYILLYNESGDVEYICDEANAVICKYEYLNTLPQVYENVDGSFVSNAEEDFIGNINPIRYQGWYYDRESSHYYMGKGIYYNAVSNRYVNNQYKIKGTRSSEPVIVRTILEAYSYYMSSETFGAADFEDSCVTEGQWNNGKRWYDGLNQTEVIARCVFAENNGEKGKGEHNGYNDRVAVAAVIINRINSGMDTSAYSAVTRSAQFSPINPGNYKAYLEETIWARKAKSKTNTAWQEATLLACTLTYATSMTELAYMRTIPAYISTQKFFLGVNYVYDNICKNENFFNISNGSWYYNGSPIKDVALAGVTSLEPIGNAKKIFEQYYLKGYNVFFNYQ